MVELIFIAITVGVYFITKSKLKFSELSPSSDFNLEGKDGDSIGYAFYGGKHAMSMILLALKKKGALRVARSKKKFKLVLGKDLDFQLSEKETAVYNLLIKIKGRRRFEFSLDDLYEAQVLKKILNRYFSAERTFLNDAELVADHGQVANKEWFKFLVMTFLVVVGVVLLPFAAYSLVYFIIVGVGLYMVSRLGFDPRQDKLMSQIEMLKGQVKSKTLSCTEQELIGVFGPIEFKRQW